MEISHPQSETKLEPFGLESKGVYHQTVSLSSYLGYPVPIRVGNRGTPRTGYALLLPDCQPVLWNYDGAPGECVVSMCNFAGTTMEFVDAIKYSLLPPNPIRWPHAVLMPGGGYRWTTAIDEIILVSPLSELITPDRLLTSHEVCLIRQCSRGQLRNICSTWMPHQYGKTHLRIIAAHAVLKMPVLNGAVEVKLRQIINGLPKFFDLSDFDLPADQDSLINSVQK